MGGKEDPKYGLKTIRNANYDDIATNKFLKRADNSHLFGNVTKIMDLINNQNGRYGLPNELNVNLNTQQKLDKFNVGKTTPDKHLKGIIKKIKTEHK